VSKKKCGGACADGAAGQVWKMRQKDKTWRFASL